MRPLAGVDVSGSILLATRKRVSHETFIVEDKAMNYSNLLPRWYFNEKRCSVTHINVFTESILPNTKKLRFTLSCKLNQ